MKAAALQFTAAVWSSIQSHPPLSSLSLCFISTAWLKSPNIQSVFLWSVPPTVPSIRLHFELWFFFLKWGMIFFFLFQTDAEKLISLGSGATIIKRYGLEEHTLWSALVGVCVLLALLECFCVGCCVSAGGGELVLSQSCFCLCVCSRKLVRLGWIIGRVRDCLCVVSPFSRSLSLYVLVWCGAATVISGLLRRSSSSAPD